MIASDEKDDVVRRSRDRERHQHVDSECRQAHEVVDGKSGDDAADRQQLEPDRQQHDQSSRKRAVGDEQHDRDHRNADAGNRVKAAVAVYNSIGAEWTRACHVSLDPRRRWHAVHDALHGGDRLVGLRAALITSEVQLDICCLAVSALRSRRGQRIAPEVLNVLDVGGVL